MKKSTEVLSILAKEILLTELITCLQTGEIHNGPKDEPLTEDETVIGELTDTEKAIFSALTILQEKSESIAKSNNQIVAEAEKKGEEFDKAQALLNKAECNAIVKMGEGLKAAMWFSIQKRFGASIFESDGIRIKNGYKIVTFESEFDDLTEMLKEALGLLD